MKAMIDTNVVIDYLDDRAPYADDAEIIFDLCGQGKMTGVLSASAITDIYYVMRKIIGREKTLESLKLLFSVFEIADVGKRDLQRAMESDVTDFEDALVAVCAIRIKAECIVTRNVGDFKNAPILSLSPRDFLSRFFPDDLKE
ncbi:MAG: PIN domain-containing protein [Clostridiales bacterium]|jgi:predicted nucleic acid-binding protein|nr:PIN domain-containing protein [Clostridiales bacterium]